MIKNNSCFLIKSRKGLIIPIVLTVSTILLAYLAITWQITVNENYMVRQNLKVMQARLIAKSGVQHLLLKTKLFPIEFYDAFALAYARNPLFRFGHENAGEANPGPRFVSNGIVVNDYICELDVQDDFNSHPPAPDWFSSCGFAGNQWPRIAGVPVNNSKLYLWKYLADVTNRNSIQPALSITTNDNPFDAVYEVVSVELLGQKDYQNYLEDTIRIVVNGTIIDEMGNTRSQNITQTIAINRNEM